MQGQIGLHGNSSFRPKAGSAPASLHPFLEVVAVMTSRLRQWATYWPPGVPDGFGGTSWGAPQHIRCRWQDKQQMIRNKEGLEIVSQSTVYVNTPIDLEGRLCRGKRTEANPDAIDGVATYEPEAADEMVAVGGHAIGWKVYL